MLLLNQCLKKKTPMTLRCPWGAPRCSRGNFFYKFHYISGSWFKYSTLCLSCVQYECCGHYLNCFKNPSQTNPLTAQQIFSKSWCECCRCVSMSLRDSTDVNFKSVHRATNCRKWMTWPVKGGCLTNMPACLHYLSCNAATQRIPVVYLSDKH